MHTGLFFIWLPLLCGLPLILLGLAIAKSPKYSAWFGWFGVASGIASTLTGGAKFLEGILAFNVIPKPPRLPGRFGCS
jgi:hypothetical protein